MNKMEQLRVFERQNFLLLSQILITEAGKAAAATRQLYFLCSNKQN